MFWHRNSSDNNKKNKKVLLFFHGAAIGGMTGYFNALSKVCSHKYHLLCYEIPNVVELDLCNTYPTLDMLNLGIMESLKSITNENQTIELSVVGHSLGCDYASSIIQYWDDTEIGTLHDLKILRKHVILIEPFCIFNSNSFMGRRMAFKIPYKFPKMVWNFIIGNLYVQLAIKRSTPRSTSVWINPKNTSWDKWSKYIITSIKDTSASPADLNDWIIRYPEMKLKHITIKGNHGSWVTNPYITSEMKQTFNQYVNV
jgi:hypothetical protein